MNGTYYSNPTFDGQSQKEEETRKEIKEDVQEESKSINIKDKESKIYTNFNNSSEWKDKTFEGKIKGLKDEYLIVEGDEENIYLIPNKYINYIKIKNN